MKGRILDDIEEIFDKNYEKFKGINEAELMAKDDIAEYILEHITKAFNAGRTHVFDDYDKPLYDSVANYLQSIK